MMLSIHPTARWRCRWCTRLTPSAQHGGSAGSRVEFALDQVGATAGATPRSHLSVMSAWVGTRAISQAPDGFGAPTPHLTPPLSGGRDELGGMRGRWVGGFLPAQE